jgi:hypothetical protein
MMTVGTLLVPLLILLVLPAVLASGRYVPLPGRVGLEDRLDRWLSKMARAIDLHPLATTGICVVLMVVTVPGLLVLQVETDFSRNFRDSSPMIQALRFVESELGPAGTWDVSFNVPQPLTTGFLERVDELTGRLRGLQEGGLQVEVVSLSDALNISDGNRIWCRGFITANVSGCGLCCGRQSSRQRLRSCGRSPQCGKWWCCFSKNWSVSVQRPERRSRRRCGEPRRRQVAYLL